jgi:hypothetical protein
MKWQPIETAPKVGFAERLWVSDYGENNIWMAYGEGVADVMRRNEAILAMDNRSSGDRDSKRITCCFRKKSTTPASS